ncbi:TPA: hypothetical protein RKT71_003810, partial [Citrobacter freundii]|nr:hypothetical protein [Citrobacter freundii]
DYVGVNDSRCRDIDLKLSFRARLGKDGEQTRGIKLLKVSIDQFCPAGFPGGCIEAQAQVIAEVDDLPGVFHHHCPGESQTVRRHLQLTRPCLGILGPGL